MKALTWHGQRDVRYEDVPDPTIVDRRVPFADHGPIKVPVIGVDLVPERLQRARNGGVIAARMMQHMLFDEQIQLRMGQANVRRWVDDLLPLLTDDDPPGVDDFATHRLPLSAGPSAYSSFQKKQYGAIKILFQPGRSDDGVHATAGAQAGSFGSGTSSTS